MSPIGDLLTFSVGRRIITRHCNQQASEERTRVAQFLREVLSLRDGSSCFSDGFLMSNSELTCLIDYLCVEC